MPRLSDLVEKRKFVKKEYRPWDLSGTGTVDNKEKTTEPTKSETISDINNKLIVEDKRTIAEHNISKSISSTTSIGNKSDNVSGNVLGNNQITTRKQSGNNQVTNREQPGNIRVTNREHTGNVTDNITGNAEEQAYLIDSIKKLAGIQKNIFYYIINLCSARGALDTGHILCSDLANFAKCSIGSAKTSLIRLLEKHLVIRFPGKASRGGHMVLGITKEIQAASIQAQQTLFNPFKISKTGNITDNVTGNSPPYSSSNNKNTTTALPDEWKKINFFPLESIGFSEQHLVDIYSANLCDPTVVQESIYHFAFGLEEGRHKQYDSPLKVFIGRLRKGNAWIESNYESPKEKALRELVTRKKAEREKWEGMIKELVDIEFPIWRKKLTESEVKKILPSDTLKTNLAPAITAALRTHYIENILLPTLERNNHDDDAGESKNRG